MNQEHYNKLIKCIYGWNNWRDDDRDIIPDLSGADMRKVSMWDANMENVDLRGADLRGAQMSGAQMQNADLRGADLRGAKMYFTNLSGANLAGADITDAVGLPVGITTIPLEKQPEDVA